jgi:hypothetical protein
MQQHLPPLSAFGWFIDTRCGPPHRKPFNEGPETLAAMAPPIADDGRKPRPTQRLWHLLARLHVSRHRNPKVMRAARPADAH